MVSLAKKFRDHGRVAIGAEVLIFSLFALAVTLGLNQILTFSAFQARDIERARDLLRGIPIWHGPKASNNFNLPGPFYYYLLAAPGLIFETWKGQWYLMMAMFAVSEGILWTFLRRNFGIVASVTALYLTLTNNMLVHNVANFWNPSYLPLFTVLILIAAFKSFSAARKLPYVITCFLLIGLASQIHFIVITYILAFFAMLAMAKYKGLPHPSWKDCALGCAAWLITWLPFFLFEKDGLLIMERFNQSQGALHALHLSGSVIPNLKLVARTLLLPPNPALPILILATVAGLIAMLKSRAPAGLTPDFKKFGLLISTLSAIALIPAFSVRFVMDIPLQFRHIVPITFFSIIALSFWFQVLCDRYPKFIYAGYAALGFEALYRQPPAVAGIAIFLGALFLAGQFFKKPALQWCLGGAIIAGLVFASFERNGRHRFKQEDSLVPLWEIEFACQNIYAMTSWKFEEARYRTYFLNLHMTSFPKPMYDDIVAAGGSAASGRDQISGFFVAHRDKIDPAITDRQSLLAWLNGKEIEKSLRQALVQGEIAVQPPFLSKDSVTVIPYHINRTSSLPQTIHNSGAAYSYKTLSVPEPVLYSSRWRECVIPDANCYVDAAVTVDNPQRPTQTNVYLHGPLSSKPKYIALFRALGLQGLYATVRCGKETFNFELADSIGYRREEGERAMNNNFMLTPVQWSLATPCAAKIDSVQVGWRKSYEVKAAKFFSGSGGHFLFGDLKTR